MAKTYVHKESRERGEKIIVEWLKAKKREVGSNKFREAIPSERWVKIAIKHGLLPKEE